MRSCQQSKTTRKEHEPKWLDIFGCKSYSLASLEFRSGSRSVVAVGWWEALRTSGLWLPQEAQCMVKDLPFKRSVLFSSKINYALFTLKDCGATLGPQFWTLLWWNILSSSILSTLLPYSFWGTRLTVTCYTKKSCHFIHLKRWKG